MKTWAAALALWACSPVVSGASSGAPGWDIAGLKLGMTEAQVRAAFRAYDPKGKIIAGNAAIPYSDKVNSFRTPNFLSSMELRVTRRSIQTPLKVWFLGTGGEARVIAILRKELNVPDAPTAEQFLQSLTAKYGRPSATDGVNTPIWEESGKPSCIRVSHGEGAPKTINHNPFSSNLENRSDFAKAVAELERWQQGGAGSARAVYSGDLTRCGAFLYYYGTQNSPVNWFSGAMFDVGAIVAAQRERDAWVERLETEAIRKRESQAQAPKL
ncbi:MAG: hypothetical protein QM661_07805 [Solimonas sp.]